MKTKEMAYNLSVSISFLEKNMGALFKEGTHYTKASDARLIRWNVNHMHNWLNGDGDDELLSKLLD
jgi:hypothetical protein